MVSRGGCRIVGELGSLLVKLRGGEGRGTRGLERKNPSEAIRKRKLLGLPT